MKASKIKTVDGHWVDDVDTTYTVNVSLGSWSGVEDEKDRDIFFYTDGNAVAVGDILAGDFVVTKIH